MAMGMMGRGGGVVWEWWWWHGGLREPRGGGFGRKN